MADVDVVLYGATGYTGRLVARQLDAMGAHFLIAGRSEERLERLQGTLDSSPPLEAVTLDDPKGLSALAARGNVLLSIAGPYREMGHRLVDAALDAGVHYADVTGEQGFIMDCLERDTAFRDRGLTAVNAVGFDVVPSDLAAHLSAKGIRADSIEMCLSTNARPSGGTRRTMASNVGLGYRYEKGRFVRTPAFRYKRTFDLPEPLGKRQAVFIPWGDVATAPRTTKALSVRTYFALPDRQVRTLHWSWPLVELAARSPFLKRDKRGKAEGAPEGPTELQRKKARFSILSEATTKDGMMQRAWVTGHDPYGLTGLAAAKAALILAKGHAREAGVLTPAQAFELERFCRELTPFHVEWGTERLEAPQGS